MTHPPSSNQIGGSGTDINALLDEIERLRALLAEIASLPPPNPAKELAAWGLCDE